MAPSERTDEADQSDQVGQPEKSRKGVIVVHGIGDQLQGDTLERLATSYVVNATKTDVDATHIDKSTLRLRKHIDTGEDKRDATETPLHIDTFKADVLTSKRLPDVIFAEVYWADISRIMSGVFGFLIGAFKILTGLRFVVEAAGNSLVSEAEKAPDNASMKETVVRFAKFARWLGNAINQLLVGPLVALNALLFFVVVTAFWVKDSLVGQNLALGVLSAIFFCAIYGLWSTRFLTYETMRDTLIAYICAVASILVAISFGHEGQYLDITEYISDSFWSVLSLGLALLVAVSFVVYSVNGDIRPSLTIACVGPCLNVGLWALALSNVWIVGLNNILPEVDVGKGEGGLVFRLFPLLSLLWGAILALGAALLVVFFVRNAKAAKHRKPPGETWRLILSQWAVLVMVIVVGFWVWNTYEAWEPVLFRADTITEGSKLHEWTKDNLWLVAVIIGFLSFFAGTISRALDLLLDIITYFQRDPVQVRSRTFAIKGDGGNADDNSVDDRPRSDGNDDDEGDHDWPPSGTSYWRRKQIADRFQCLVNYMVRRQEVNELTIMAHSQGTVTAIEQLATINDWLELPSGKSIPAIRLITIGSPYSHIYQHYFPKDFGNLSLNHVKRWVNIYTVNDYVGTEIKAKGDKKPISVNNGDKPININREDPFGIDRMHLDQEIIEANKREARSLNIDDETLDKWRKDSDRANPIGHNGYWTDELVMDFIRELAPLEGKP